MSVDLSEMQSAAVAIHIAAEPAAAEHVSKLLIHAVDEIEKLLAEVERLRAGLPVTADGVCIVQDDLVFRVELSGGKNVTTGYKVKAFLKNSIALEFGNSNFWVSPQHVYSTEAAARLAMEGGE